MNTWRWLLVPILSCLVTTAVAAAAPGTDDAQAREQPGPQERTAPLDRWLERLRLSHPEEHERLVRLRRENHEAFGQEMRQRAREERIRRALDPHPELQAAFNRLTPEEQDRVMMRLGRGSRGPRTRLPRGVTENLDQLQAIEQAVDALLDACLQAPAGEERDRLTEALRNEVARLYDHRTAAHAEVLAQMKQHLEEVRGQLKERGAHRESWIQQRMEALLAPSQGDDS